jgi:hypothetical protein
MSEGYETALPASSRLVMTKPIMMFVAERSTADWIVCAAQNTNIIPGMETNIIRNGEIATADYQR